MEDRKAEQHLFDNQPMVLRQKQLFFLLLPIKDGANCSSFVLMSRLKTYLETSDTDRDNDEENNDPGDPRHFFVGYGV